jgi:trk system potassium uptake protein TrkH
MKSSLASFERGWPRLSLFVLGYVCFGLGLLMLVLALFSLALGRSSAGFWVGGGLGLLLGWPLHALGDWKEPRRVELLFTVAVLWLVLPFLGAIPFWLSGGFSYLDALFEAMSALTTTGATVLVHFSHLDPFLFVWRSLLAWLGGLAILITFVTVFIPLGVAGRQLFQDPTVQREALPGRLREAARSLVRVYALLSVLAFLAFGLSGMPWFAAFCNSLSTVATAGFSVDPRSFAHYGPLTQWVALVVMFLAGSNYLFQYRLFFRGETRVLREPEVRAYVGVILGASAILFAELLARHRYAWEGALRHALFEVTSIVSTSGLASADRAHWGLPAQLLLLLLMFVGGSLASSAGSIKILRWLILGGLVRRELQRTLHPQAVLPLRLGARPLADEVLRSVAAFVTLYLAVFAIGALLLAMIQGDFLSALSASAQALGNIGAGLSQGMSYGSFQPLAKLVMILEMWMGRVELIPAFLWVLPEFWRKLRA